MKESCVSRFLTSIYRIGELSLIKELTKAVEISQAEEQEEAAAAAAAAEKGEANDASSKTAPSADPKAPYSATSPTSASPTSPKSANNTFFPASNTTDAGVPPSGSYSTPVLTITGSDTQSSQISGMSSEGKKSTTSLEKEKKKKNGLTQAQREEMLRLEQERKAARVERVEHLSKKLIERLSLYTESDKRPDVIQAFKEKTRVCIDSGIEIVCLSNYFEFSWSEKT